MNLNFKNRITYHYIVATATLMALVFGAIFFTVKNTVLENLDSDLSYEATKHTGEIVINGERIYFANKAEWEEREHRESEVNPVFIQLMDKQGNLMDKSPNLKLDKLSFKPIEFEGHFNTKLNQKNIRQIQLPIERKGKIKGYMLAAMSYESALSVISKLRNVLLVSYFIVLIGVYFVSRFLAGRSIKPVREISNTITRITRNNLNERVSTPQNQDEIHELSTNFNALLERIENAIEREKQFTSDASHELRTPLATLRGTLEVLIRRPRNQAEYEEKIRYSLNEIDRMTSTLEQLLLLARLDNSNHHIKHDEWTSLPKLIDESISKFKDIIKEKNLKINTDFTYSDKAYGLYYYSKIIIDNVLGNAIKYSNANSNINIGIKTLKDKIICKITDEGIGIKEEDLNRIYDSFFRSDPLNHKKMAGNGLGLSIAKKCADAIGAKIEMESNFGYGTTVNIIFLSQS
ncbi:Signal transduction histidine kinase [Salegentibacter holothuriorum]|uniref:histidine kinase n=1 Tax=Salegentibacter holothuriorum TaxID=241145 RepID=A0A1T5AL60_9FLAO|nr:HAMP domain-containing sensor histidine kinase [Salegentibacter holothuriorum]SKB35718.1 Signal transduction histidine kinase [Salegentibacter holothuriorum]